MSQKAMVFTAIGISAFIIAVAIAGFTLFIKSPFNSTISEEVLAQKIAQREQAYQILIADANEKITNLNAQLEKKSANNIRNTSLSTNEVVSLAKQLFGSDLIPLKGTELVLYQGQGAYELQFIEGFVYIDANTGEVLYSDLPLLLTEQQAIQIAADYLEIRDHSSAKIINDLLDGDEVFRVSLKNYLVYIDKTGNILKVQVIQYVSASNNSTSQSSSRNNDDHEEHEEHDEEDEEDND